MNALSTASLPGSIAPANSTVGGSIEVTGRILLAVLFLLAGLLALR